MFYERGRDLALVPLPAKVKDGGLELADNRTAPASAKDPLFAQDLWNKDLSPYGLQRPYLDAGD